MKGDATWETLPAEQLDPRDLSPDDHQALFMPDGRGMYVVGIYAGAAHRDVVIASAGDKIRAEADRALCGTTHAAEVEVFDLPHTGRPSVRVHLRRTRAELGPGAQLIRCWQHYGPCDEARRAVPS